MCGGRTAHPLLISLANVKMAVRNKGSSHVFLLLALMPIIKFTHPVTWMRSVLDAHLFHQCLDIILEPLKQATRIGHMMSDPTGNLWYCFTPLVSYIANTPEACMLACMRGLTSLVTMASYKNFGDSDQHLPHTTAITLAQLTIVMDYCNPNDVNTFFAVCKQFHLSGISYPFWHNWPLAEPSCFLTPEGLHHWLCEFWDHDFTWCMWALDDVKLDFWFSILPPITSLCHFSSGVIKLKQVTGWAQQDILCYIVAVITGTADQSIVTVIRTLVNFWYFSQAPHILMATCDKIQSALIEFHDHKHTILAGSLHHGQTTSAPLDHWQILKLELMLNVVLSIEQVGSPTVVCRYNGACAYWSC